MESYNKSFVDEDQEEEKPSQVSDETESDVSSSSSSEDGFRDVVLEDGNMVNLTRKRSKRTRKLESFTTKKMKITEADAEHEAPHSSASDTTTEEDLAFCLMMLSRDKWKNKSYYYQEEEEEEGYKMIKKGRYKCETCGKVFKSYQALGGHRASHKKNRVCNDNVVAVAVTVPIEKRVHQCPICYRVFASGQALGGHKRSHGIGNLSLVNHHHHHQRVIKQRMLDLNLPAPNEEEQVSVVFQ